MSIIEIEYGAIFRKIKSSIFVYLMIVSIAGCLSMHDMNDVNKLEENAKRSRKPYIITPSNVKFSPKTRTISYTLPEAAKVRLRAGIQDGPLLRTLIDWEEQEAGEQVIAWDFYNTSGNVDFSKVSSDFHFAIQCIPLTVQSERIRYGRVAGLRKAPRCNIEFPDSFDLNKRGIQIVKGQTALRIKLDKRDKLWLTESRYEVGVFIDLEFLFEDEEGVDPFTYYLDTLNINNGIHIITVNIVGYDGEIGTKSALIDVQN